MPMRSPFVSQALERLRRSISTCCWVVALALLIHTMIWAVATFMDVRHTRIEAADKPELIVSTDQTREHVSPLTGVSQAAARTMLGDEAVDPNRVPTKYDHIMSKASALAMSAGTIAMVLMMPLLALGALLAAGSATPGVEKTVSAFGWSLVVGLLVMPVGQWLGLPWQEGALASYGLMTQQVDLLIGDSLDNWGTPTFYCRFAVLPLACVVGVAMIGLKFSAGVHAGIIQKESMRLDPALEKEAANIKPGTLHGGRAASAMSAISSTGERSAANASAGNEPPPRRLI